MFKFLRNFAYTIYKAIDNLIIHDGVEHAGYMAFVSLLAFFPFLVFLMAFTGFIGSSKHGIEIINLLLSNLPVDLIASIKPRIDEITSGPPSSLLTISILGIVWTSSSTLEGLRTILNKIYRVNSPPTYIFRRTLSILHFFIIIFLMVLLTFILLLFPMIIEEISSTKYIKDYLNYTPEMFQPIWENFRHFSFVIMMFAGVMYLYYIIPNVKLKIKSLIPGSILVVILWILSGYLMSQYVFEFTSVNFVYGSLAGVVTTMLFFYTIHLIFIFGAEFNKLLDDGLLESKL